MRSLPGSLPLTEAPDELTMRPLPSKTGSVLQPLQQANPILKGLPFRRLLLARLDTVFGASYTNSNYNRRFLSSFE